MFLILIKVLRKKTLYEKGLKLLDPSIYGVFAKIGAGKTAIGSLGFSVGDRS